VGDGPLLGDGLWSAIELMLGQCPVVHSDGQWFGMPDGGWIVNRYRDIIEVVRDPERFSSVDKKGTSDEPDMPPFDVDPPIHGEYRRLLQPYFTKPAVSKFEPLARGIVNKLIDGFIETGRCDDIVASLTRPFSSQVKWGWLVGLEGVDLDEAQDWIETWLYRHFEPEFEHARHAWIKWMDATIARRRREPRRSDLIDALLHGEVEGRPLTDLEVRGVLMIMILGGFSATGDAIANILFRLAVYPDLQRRLVSERALLPSAIEEFLRIEPPVTGIARSCTRDTKLGGQHVKAGERVFYHSSAANRDPEIFEEPLEVRLDRTGNRHLAFGAGRHRCIGAGMARMNIRVALEEILTRLRDIRLIERDPPNRMANVAWRLTYLPLIFTPGQRLES
jgi:cytochrome P450